MAGNTRQVAAFGPPAVAVHDDRDMFWELVRIKLAVEFSFLSVQPRRNGSQNASQYTSTLAQQLWSCNFLAPGFVSWLLKPVPRGGPPYKSKHFREYLRWNTPHQ